MNSDYRNGSGAGIDYEGMQQGQHGEDEAQLFSNDEPADVRAINLTFGKRRNEHNSRSLFREAQEILTIFRRYGLINSDDLSLLQNDAIRVLFIQMDKLYKSTKPPLTEVFSRALSYLVMLPKLVNKPKTGVKVTSPNRIYAADGDVQKQDEAEPPLTNGEDTTVVCWEKIQLERNIGGVKVLFPFPSMSKPQLQILSKMIHAVKNSEHVVLESPTGTGKTAAILSGLFSWLYQRQILEVSPNPESMVTTSTTSASESELTIIKPESLTTGGESVEKKRETQIDENLVMPPTSQVEKNTPLKTRVVYLTRTHVQIRQVMDAIKKSGFRPKSCTMGSRLQLCIYTPDRPNYTTSDEDGLYEDPEMDKRESVNATCKTLLSNADRLRAEIGRGYDTCTGRKPLTNKKKKDQVCPYYVNMGCKNYAIGAALRLLSKDNAIWDIEDLITFGNQSVNEMTSVGCSCDDREEMKPRKKQPTVDITTYFNQHPRNYDRPWEDGVCPYYMSKAISQVADFIVCPYPYVVDPQNVAKGSKIANHVAMELLTDSSYEDVRQEIMEVINERTNIAGTGTGGIFGNLSNTILVFDEGHNLENSCIEEASWDMDLTKMRGILKWLHTLRARNKATENSELSEMLDSGGNVKVTQMIERVVNRIIVFLQELLGRVETFINSIENNQYEAPRGTASEKILFSWDRYDRDHDQLSGSFEFLKSFDLNIVKVYIVYCSVMQLVSQRKTISLLGMTLNEDYRSQLEYSLAIMVIMCSRPECYNVLILTNGDKRHSLGFWLMNPAAMFDELSMNVRSIIIASGTLSPIPAMVCSLGNEFEARLKENIISTTQTLSSDQFALLTITNFANKHHQSDIIECNYKNLKDANFMIQLGNSIASLMEVLPGGTLVFFPNKSAIAACIELWKETPYRGAGITDLGGVSIYDRMMQVKGMNVYQEPTEASQFAKMLRELKEMSIFAMLAVYRSHASEGLNLKLSSIILVGLPFPSIVAPKVDMARRYHKAKSEKFNWYLRETYRAVNQSIGRCIRTRYDRGVVILMDRRYTRNRDFLSPWVNPYSRTHHSVDSAKHSIKTNFKF